MIKIEINKYNFHTLPLWAHEIKRRNIKGVELDFVFDAEECANYEILRTYLEDFLNFEKDFFISYKNIPHCLLNWRAADHINNRLKKRGEKKKECRECVFQKKCCGFPKGYFKKYGQKELCVTKDLPVEVMFEVESRCNFNCHFCFNRNSFAKHGRDIKSLSTAYVKKIIDNIASSEIEQIRFTGGEPMLRNNIVDLIKYAHNKGLRVWLNTNASLLNKKTVKKIENYVENVLIPLESWSTNLESKITGFKDTYRRKIEALEFLDKSKIEAIRVGTVASQESIKNFYKIFNVIEKFRISQWEFYRPISGENKKMNIKKGYLERLVKNIHEIREKRPETRFYIANSLPICAISDINALNSASCGSFADIGHTRLVIDPRGFVKPHYFMDSNIGDPLDILGAWNHPMMKKIRNFGFLPKECNRCPFVYKCRGGNRYEANLAYGSYDSPDPMADYGNLKLFKKQLNK